MELYSLEKVVEHPSELTRAIPLGIFDRTALKNFLVNSKRFDEQCALLKTFVYSDKQFALERGVIDEATVSFFGKFVYRIKYEITPVIAVRVWEKNGGKQMEKDDKKYRDPFEGMSFKGVPVSKKEYLKAYENYVNRCSG